MPRADDAMIGRTIAGKFLIESLIGSGAMGHVYRAQQVALEKTVALKVLHQDLARDPTFTVRFHREAKAASRLDHPNSMRVIDFGSDPDGTLYIAMEHLDGRDLLRVIQEDGALPTERIAGILTQALAALVVAHDMGVVHRDLKPENIMILEAIDDEGRRTDVVKVCDFGIAKITGRTGMGTEPARGPITTAGLVVGTPEYMSPEQGKGDPLDARSDLYSMGVILFHLMTGRVPFDAENVLGIVFKHVNEPPPKPSQIRPGADPRLEAVCMRALQKNRDERYQTAREMRAALRPIAGSDGVVFPSSVPRTLPSYSGELSQAKTLDMPGAPSSAGAGSAPAVSDAPVSRTRGTTGATAALPPLPVSRPSLFWMGAFALAVGAGGTLAYAKFGGMGDAPVAATNRPPVVGASSSSAIPAVTAAVEPSGSAPPSAPVAAVAHAPAVSAPHPTASKTPASPHGPSPAAASPASTAFSLTTSVASPSVQRATGVATRDVRAALPSWKFTQCYRDAMQRSGKRLEGHVGLTVTIDSAGVVSRVSIVGPPGLLSGAGSCLEDAVNQLHIRNSSPSGAVADIDLTCTPE